jgi:hypothetical protein
MSETNDLLCRNIKILVEFDDENGVHQEKLYLVPEGFIWHQEKNELKANHLETLKSGGEVTVPASIEIRVTHQATVKRT